MGIDRLRGILLTFGICLTLCSILPAETPEAVIGFWKSIDEQEGFTTSIMAVYRYDDQLYGRIIVSFDEQDGTLLETHEMPLQRVSTLPSNPKLLAVDLFWDLQWENSRWRDGKILDPRTGKTYTCETWVKGNLLILRGKVGPFGMNTIFHQAREEDFPSGYDPPDLRRMVPNRPHL